MDLLGIVKIVLVVNISVGARTFLCFLLTIENFKFMSCYLKIDHIDVAANEKYNTVKVSLDNSDLEKTAINYHSELTSNKPLQRAKVHILD